ncbi:MAG: hypothetical protein ACK2UI_03345 [Anaerolineae bacterium]|jgi:hypothetical protein
MRCLLDKVVARYTLTGLLKLAEDNAGITREELFSLELFARAASSTLRLFVTPASMRVLQRLAGLSRYAVIVRRFREGVDVAFPTQYYKRWTRRLRSCGFAREDAAVLALATFGTDEEATILGMHFVATYDQPLINNWTVQEEILRTRLETMQHDIPVPYCDALLPKVLRPEQIVF